LAYLLSNLRMGYEIAIPRPVATRALVLAVDAARSLADDRWQRELVAWLGDRTRSLGHGLDVGDLAWTPEHFVEQQRFVVAALTAAAAQADDDARIALHRFAALVAGHDRSWVVVGRRWSWAEGPPTLT
jgi:hypothetical protein